MCFNNILCYFFSDVLSSRDLKNLENLLCLILNKKKYILVAGNIFKKLGILDTDLLQARNLVNKYGYKLKIVKRYSTNSKSIQVKIDENFKIRSIYGENYNDYNIK